MYDNALIQSSVPFDANAFVRRNQEISQKLMDIYNEVEAGPQTINIAP